MLNTTGASLVQPVVISGSAGGRGSDHHHLWPWPRHWYLSCLVRTARHVEQQAPLFRRRLFQTVASEIFARLPAQTLAGCDADVDALWCSLAERETGRRCLVTQVRLRTASAMHVAAMDSRVLAVSPPQGPHLTAA